MINKIPAEYRKIVEALEKAGHETYFVGGCVRDLCLHREPKDFDITTSATPHEVAAVLQYSGADVDLVGANFGVSIVRFLGATAEVATFRTDGAYSDSRRPDEVKYTKDVREDLKRRDFTINALLLDSKGALLDRVGGLRDLADEELCCVGEAIDRFTEDPLRMLRAVRFAAQLGFSMNEETWRAIQSESFRVETVSAERIAIELSKILASGRAAQGVHDLYTSGLSHFFLSELGDLRHTAQNPKHHPEGDVFVHTLKLLGQLPKDCSLTLALAALLHDIGKPGTLGMKDGQPTAYGHEKLGAKLTGEILRRLKFPNDVIETVVTLVAQHMNFRLLPEMRKSKRYRFLRQDNFAELLELHRMDCLAGSGNLKNYEEASKMLLETPPEILKPAKLITGFDLIACGLKPGPRFKTLLTRIEDAQLEGTVVTRADALEIVTDYIGNREAE